MKQFAASRAKSLPETEYPQRAWADAMFNISLPFIIIKFAFASLYVKPEVPQQVGSEKLILRPLCADELWEHSVL